VCLLAFAGCGAREPLPPLPEVSTAAFAPPIRKAVDEALAAARARPEDAAAVGRLGMVLHAHQQLGAARACYRRASLLDRGDFDWLYYLGAASEGAAAAGPLRAALRIRDYLPAKLRLGDALLAAGDHAAAREVFRGIDHPAALFGYGRAVNDGRYYEKAVAAFPQFGAAIFALAQHYRRNGRTAEADRLMAEYPKYKTVAPPVDDPLMRAVDELNQGPDRLIQLAAGLESQGQLAAAAGLQVKALELDPKLTQAHVNLISLYGRLGDAASAEKHYRLAVAVNPNAYEAYYNFGVLCYGSGRRADARAAFEKALAINDGHAPAHNNLGAMLQEQGQLAEAAAHFRRAVELDPGLRLARFHLGRIYANQRRFREAIDEFERAAAVDDEATPAYLYALGATKARAGDAAGARATLTRAREKALARAQTALAGAIERDLGALNR
jgi:tetratricopeptide (TPR) repeat protein